MYSVYPVMNMIVISLLCFTFNKLALCVENDTFFFGVKQEKIGNSQSSKKPHLANQEK